MSEVDPVILKLIADVGTYNARIANSEKLTDQRLSAIERKGFEMGQSISRSFTMASKAALTFAAGFVTIDLARKFIEIVDEAKKMDAQLALATRTFGSFTQAQQDVQRIAAATRSGLSETTSLYGNFVRSVQEVGGSQDDAARATETFSKTLKISGADAQQAASATLQFGQALASGALRGDELNSILEASPRLARLLTESMGTSIGQIKKLGEEGKLTSDKLLAALTNQKFTAGIDAEFRELPVTFDDAMTQVSNAAMLTFSAFDRGGQFSAALVSFISDGADGFDDLSEAAEDFGRRTRAAIEGLAGAFEPVFAEAKRLFALFESGTGDLSFDPARELGDIDKVTGWFSRQGILGRVATGNPWDAKNPTGTNFRGRYIASRDAANKRLRGEAAEREVGAMVGRYFDRFGNPTRPQVGARPSPASSGGSGGKKNGGGARSAEAAARKAEQERLRAIRDDANKAQEGARLSDQILAAREALAVAAEDVLKFQLDAVESERNQRNAQAETEVKLGNLTREEADLRIIMNNELAGLQRQLVKRRADEAIAAREAARLRDRQDTERAEAQLITAREARRDAELRILDLAYKEEEAAIRRAAANGQIADLDEALANLKRRRAADEEGVLRQGESPGKKYLRDLNVEAENLGDAYEDVAVRGLERMNDALSDSIQSALGLHGVLGDIIGDFIELALRQAVLGPLANALFGGATGGGILGSVFGLTGKRAAGGPVSAGGTYLVGENGPEILRMGGTGHVVPNHQLARGGGGVVQNVTIKVDAQGALLANQVQAMVAQGMQQAAVIATEAGAQRGKALVIKQGRNTLR